MSYMRFYYGFESQLDANSKNPTTKWIQFTLYL